MNGVTARTETVASALEHAVCSLAATVPSAALDARVLLQFVTGLDHASVLRDPRRPLSPMEQQHFDEALARRRDGEPVAYITGEREFWSLPLRVTGDTLIPRPDTEVLVERALARIPEDAQWRIADLGTGSGAVALAIARERPRCRVIATDRSAEALAVARDNAERLHLRKLEFRPGSWFDVIAPGECQVVVSNPPYVPDGDPHLDSGDVHHEPRLALVGGSDGLDPIRLIIAGAAMALTPGSWLLLEHGFDQGEAVQDLLARAEFEMIETHRDLAGLERVTGAQRKED